MANRTSQHILGTASNLMGFCLFVITALNISDHSGLTIIDECTAVISVLLAVSAFLSFLSLRSNTAAQGTRFESIAEIIFMIALIGVGVVILLIALNFLS